MIRLAKRGDLPAILSIFSYARKFMSQQGNPTQWGTTYPSRKLVIEDIEHEICYVFEKMGQIVGVFTLIIGEDETYQFIEKGDWHLNQLYGTIHRLASNGQAKGLAKQCFEFCSRKVSYLRIDTHKDNRSMQAAIRKFGFQECGVIYVADGSSRLAFDYYHVVG